MSCHLRPRAAALVFVSVLGFAMMFGCIGFGAAARGVSVYAFCGAGMALFVATQLLMVLRVPLPPELLLAAYGVFGGTDILSYAVMSEYFPPHMIGRVNTTLTLVIFLLRSSASRSASAHIAVWARQEPRGKQPDSSQILRIRRVPAIIKTV